MPLRTYAENLLPFGFRHRWLATQLRWNLWPDLGFEKPPKAPRWSLPSTRFKRESIAPLAQRLPYRFGLALPCEGGNLRRQLLRLLVINPQNHGGAILGSPHRATAPARIVTEMQTIQCQTRHRVGKAGAVQRAERKRRSEDVAARFGRNLVRCRRRADLSQEELAVRSSLHRTEIGMLENGVRVARIDTLVQLAGAMSIPPGDLLEGIFWTPGDKSHGGFSFSGERPPPPRRRGG